MKIHVYLRKWASLNDQRYTSLGGVERKAYVLELDAKWDEEWHKVFHNPDVMMAALLDGDVLVSVYDGAFTYPAHKPTE